MAGSIMKTLMLRFLYVPPILVLSDAAIYREADGWEGLRYVVMSA